MVKVFKTAVLVSLLAVFVLIGFPPTASAETIPTEKTPMIAAIPGFKALFGGTRPPALGVKEGRLATCPKSPNCVVSQGEADAEHAIAPLNYAGSAADAMNVLRQVVAAQDGSEVIEQTEQYLYAEFTSNLMGFVDDVEFYLPPDEPGIIHVRSASRLGESDLGVNRKRIERIRAMFSA